MSMTSYMQVFRIFWWLGSRRWRPVSGLAWAIYAFFMITFLATGVQATIIFDNFDSNGGFSGQDNSAAAGANWLQLHLKNANREAVQFTVTGGDFNLSSITLPISFMGNGPNNTLRVRLVGDSSDAPGTTLEVLSENESIWPNFTNPFTTTTTLTSVGNPLLANGDKYWIVTELTSFVQFGEYVDYRLFQNTSGTTVPTLQQQTIGGSLPADPWPDNTSNINVAFRVEGTPVPLPPSLWLLGSGLLSLGGWRRFRKS